jgi:hypothetical protein
MKNKLILNVNRRGSYEVMTSIITQADAFNSS